MSEEPEKSTIFDLMLHVLEMMGGFESNQRVTRLFDTIKKKAVLWGVPEEYHDVFIRIVLGAQNLGQVLSGLRRIVGSCEEMGIENPMIEPITALIVAQEACVIQGFQTVCSMVRDVPSKDVDEFMFEVTKVIVELTG